MASSSSIFFSLNCSYGWTGWFCSVLAGSGFTILNWSRTSIVLELTNWRKESNNCSVRNAKMAFFLNLLEFSLFNATSISNVLFQTCEKRKYWEKERKCKNWPEPAYHLLWHAPWHTRILKLLISSACSTDYLEIKAKLLTSMYSIGYQFRL